MTVMESQALTDLLARAGASDTDRPAWLAERRQGITATEIRDLVIGAVSQQRLIDLKLGRTPEPDDLSHIPVIGWGREREVVIAEALRGTGIEPETRVFHAADNSRHLGSPDGVGVDFDDALIVSEIKTHEKDLPPGSVELEQKGYLIQILWAMHVTGARRCKYVVEERVTVGHDSKGRPNERKPWEDAQYGEVWAVTEASGQELYRVTHDGLFEQVSGSDGRLSMPITHWSIVDGFRVWPEDAS